MTPQAKRREKEKRRRVCAEKKGGQTKSVTQHKPSRARSIIKNLFKNKDSLRFARSKFAIWKTKFATKLINRQDPSTLADFSTYYKHRAARYESF